MATCSSLISLLEAGPVLQSLQRNGSAGKALRTDSNLLCPLPMRFIAPLLWSQPQVKSVLKVVTEAGRTYGFSGGAGLWLRTSGKMCLSKSSHRMFC